MGDLREIATKAIKDYSLIQADAVIAAIEPALRRRHRAELLGELREIFGYDAEVIWCGEDLHAVLTEEAIQAVKAVFARQEAEDDR